MTCLLLGACSHPFRTNLSDTVKRSVEFVSVPKFDAFNFEWLWHAPFGHEREKPCSIKTHIISRAL